jgi:hypothetical protein
MNSSTSSAETAEIVEEVIDPVGGVLPRLQEFFQATAEQAQPLSDGGRVPAMEEWGMRDSFAFVARQLGDIVGDLAGIGDELRARESIAPNWQAGVAMSRSTTARPMPNTSAEPAQPAPALPAQAPVPRRGR